MAQQFAKVEKRTSKVVTVQASAPNLTDAEKNTHEVKQVSESVKPGDYLDNTKQASSEAEDRKARAGNPNPRQQAEGTKESELDKP